jgi:hypothetical protein
MAFNMSEFIQGCQQFQDKNGLSGTILKKAAGENAATPSKVFLEQAAQMLGVTSLTKTMTKAQVQAAMYPFIMEWVADNVADDEEHEDGEEEEVVGLEGVLDNMALSSATTSVPAALPRAPARRPAVSTPALSAVSGADTPARPRALSRATAVTGAPSGSMAARPSASAMSQATSGTANTVRNVSSDAGKEILAFALENKLVIYDDKTDTRFVFVLKKACSGAKDVSKAQRQLHTMLLAQGISQPTWDRLAAIVIGEYDADLKKAFALMKQNARRSALNAAMPDMNSGAYECYNIDALKEAVAPPVPQ